jgi:hypothetical protein
MTDLGAPAPPPDDPPAAIDPGTDIAFVCDAMLGGLARWLRAAGYDAEFEHGISDPALVARAAASGRMLLSSDSGIFERSVVRKEVVRSLFIPRGIGKAEQLLFVLRELKLPIREPRCMGCGGELVEVQKEDVRAEAPERTFECQARFWRCARCGKLLWKGTHWQRIEAGLGDVAKALAEPAVPAATVLLDSNTGVDATPRRSPSGSGSGGRA